MVPPAPAHRLYAHLAWTTLGGRPLVAPAHRASAESRLIQLVRALDAEPIEACVLPDRAHLLLRFRTGHSLGELARRIRRGSAAGSTGVPGVPWGRGYVAVTVSPGEVRDLRRRIARAGEEPWPEGAFLLRLPRRPHPPSALWPLG